MQNEQTVDRGQSFEPMRGQYPGHVVGQSEAQSFDPAFVISHSGRVGSSAHQNAAASAFFAKKHNGKLAGNGHPLPLGRARHNDDSEEERTGRQETVSDFSIYFLFFDQGYKSPSAKKLDCTIVKKCQNLFISI